MTAYIFTIFEGSNKRTEVFEQDCTTPILAVLESAIKALNIEHGAKVVTNYTDIDYKSGEAFTIVYSFTAHHMKRWNAVKDLNYEKVVL